MVYITGDTDTGSISQNVTIQKKNTEVYVLQWGLRAWYKAYVEIWLCEDLKPQESHLGDPNHGGISAQYY